MASIISASTTSGTALNMSADTTGVLQLATGATPTTAVTVDASQNVGIGTASPASSLDVQAADARSIIRLTATTGTNPVYSRASNTGGFLYLGRDGSGGTDFGAGAYAAGVWSTGAYPMAFGTNGTERMRIDSIGNVLVGGTANVGPGSGKIAITSPDMLNTVGGLGVKNNTNNTGGSFAFWVNSSNAIIGTISQNSSTTVGYNTSSDYRLKENIAPMTGALDKVSALKPVTYTWKADGSDGQGFIAHELAEVMPDCVSGEKDAVNEDGSIKAQGIDTSFLVATLTAAIQEQQTIINDLKARIETLETK